MANPKFKYKQQVVGKPGTFFEGQIATCESIKKKCKLFGGWLYEIHCLPDPNSTNAGPFTRKYGDFLGVVDENDLEEYIDPIKKHAIDFSKKIEDIIDED